MKVKDPQLSYDELHNALMELPDTGPEGFEGFVRDALAEVSGHAFKLMKSGPQGGVDAIGEPSANGLSVGMEGKQYGLKTRLPLDALKSKLRDAAATFPMLDIWVLAATRAIDGGDTRALGRTGEELGVDVLVLDWETAGAIPPVLAILCASAPASTAHHLACTTAVQADLASVQASSFYLSELDRLRNRLQDPATGLAAARNHLRNWTRRQMQDSATARLSFDSNAVLEAPGIRRIARPGVEQRLDQWWTTPTQPAALLGMEGMGKTWSLLAWWLAKVTGRNEFPLTVILPARDVKTTDAVKLIAGALYAATGVRDAAFWQRRVERWSHVVTDRPLILLVVDGLNQAWEFRGWSDLVTSTQTPTWKGRIAVALTCRPDHFEHRLKSLCDLEGGVSTIPVGQFDDLELDALLQEYELERDGLEPALVELIRKPRLSRLAIEQRASLSAGGEITAERLVYEDWRHRHPGAQRVLSHDEFKRFVAGLGSSADAVLSKASLSRSELLDRLSADGGSSAEEFQVVLSELIDGGWLEADGLANRFTLRRQRVPAALGLTLVADLASAISIEEAEERFANLLDPLQESDLAVSILRNATTFALADSRVQPNIQRLLLERWITAQNFAPNDFQAYWRLVGLAPHLALEVAESEWFGTRSGGRADEVLVKGFANAWRWNDVADALKAKLLEWFSRYWLDFLQGEVFGQIDDDENAQKRRSETAERAQAAADERIAARFGLSLRLVEPEQQAWGSYRAVELLSWLPRAPLIDVFTAWAITSAILGRFRQPDAMAWVLRWNPEDSDEAESAILTRAAELQDTPGNIGQAASRKLLSSLASPAAQALLDRQCDGQGEKTSGVPQWEEGLTESGGGAPLSTVSRLIADPLDPELILPRAWIDRLVGLASSTSDEQLLDGDGYRESGLEVARLSLARWAPSALGMLIRRRFAAVISRSAPAVPPVPRWKKLISRFVGGTPTPELLIPVEVDHLPGAMIALEDDDLRPWQSLSEAAMTQATNTPFGLHVVTLATAAAGDQIDLLTSIMPETGLPGWAARLLMAPEAKDLDAIAVMLNPSQPESSVIRWLQYIGAAPRGARPSGWEPLGSLTRHESANVRAAALKVIVAEEDEILCEMFAETGWKFEGGMNREEAAYGSLALTMAPSAADGSMAGQVHPDALGSLLHRYPDQAVYLDAFAEHVRSELEYLQTTRSRVYGRSLLTVPRGWEELLLNRREDFMAWMQPFLSGGAAASELVFLAEEFPIIRALDAADKLLPGTKARAVAKALSDNQSSAMRSGDLYRMATEVSGPGADEVRELALEEANTDKKLFDFALGLQRNGHTDWLRGRIDQDLASQTAGKIARGFVLAGFLASSEENDGWWAVHDRAPASGWLSDVHAWASAEYRRFANVKHWILQFRSASDPIAAYAAFELAKAGADDRLLIGEIRPSLEEIAAWPWRMRMHWTLGWEPMKARMKKYSDGLEKRFLNSVLPLQHQVPRCH